MKIINVIGIGPGSPEQMTFQAREALEESDIIIGYTVYVELLRPIYPDKRFLSTPMRQEIERCRMAFEEAGKGMTTAFVCSGDAGVYGMSGLLLEMGQEYPQVEIRIISGITACIAGASILGAPLVHDFAVISLSDLLTPWEKIEKRICMAAGADFVICFYNPSSKKRADYLARACDLVLEFHKPDTVCGIVENIGRENENSQILTLGQLRDTKTNMFTTVYIGNSQTKRLGEKMVTPRGYQYE